MKKNKYIEVYLAIYRCSVIISWEKDINKIIRFAQKRGVQISDDWKTSFTEEQGDNISGVCMDLGDKNTDILVWLKEKPKQLSSFGFLYHELYHAVDHISEAHNLSEEREARAYIFEYLINNCNKKLWT